MKKYDWHNPNQAVATKTRTAPETVEQSLAPEVAAKLVEKAKQAVERPNVAELIAEVPDVVRWLRSQMVSTPKPSEDGGSTGGAPGSKPPFRMAFMAAADREVAALAWWCDLVGIKPSYHQGFWVENGQIKGVSGDDLKGVEELAGRLAMKVGSSSLDQVSLASDETYGFWTIRSQHYANWPELAGYLATEFPEEPEPLIDDMPLF